MIILNRSMKGRVIVYGVLVRVSVGIKGEEVDRVSYEVRKKMGVL